MAKDFEAKQPAKKQKSRSQPQASGRELLVIDNQPLRARHFAEAQKVIEKIERLEGRIQSFHTSDQKLFNQWFDLTFRKNRQQAEVARTQYQELAKFHNWIVAIAHKLDIEMPQAYILMRNEQLRWNEGTAEERSKIELDRERRDEYIRQEFRAKYNENFSYDDGEDSDDELANGGIEGLKQVLDRLEEMVFETEPLSALSAEDRIDRLLAMSDDALIEAMEDQEVAFMMFDVSLNWGQTHDDYSLFKRLWKLMTGTQKEFFSHVYTSVTGEPIEQFLVSIGLSPDFSGGSAEDEDEDDEDEDINFNDQYIDPRRAKGPEAARNSATDTEKLKQTFRKLMRKLHPDVHAAESNDGRQPPWVQRVWEMVQNAYNAKNGPTLERLLKLTLIRMNVLDELTVGEIAEARHWLKRDLENLEAQSSELKYSLAWGFSQKKNYNSLTQKIEKQFNSELREIKDQITELEDQHRLFELLAERPARRPQERSSRRGRQSSRSQPRQRSRRTSRQQEFSFDE